MVVAVNAFRNAYKCIRIICLSIVQTWRTCNGYECGRVKNSLDFGIFPVLGIRVSNCICLVIVQVHCLGSSFWHEMNVIFLCPDTVS